MRWQKRPEGRPPRSLKSEHSLPHQSWRAIAADQLEASIRVLGRMIATFAAIDRALAEVGSTIDAINDDLKQVTR